MRQIGALRNQRDTVIENFGVYRLRAQQGHRTEPKD